MSSKLKKIGSVAGAASGVLALTLLSASPAVADPYPFRQDFGSGSYHASHDYTPTVIGQWVGGYGCGGGSASYWYSQTVLTSGSVTQFSTYSYPTDGQWHNDPRFQSNYVTQSYYMRWYGQNGSLSNGYSAPCAGVGASYQ